MARAPALPGSPVAPGQSLPPVSTSAQGPPLQPLSGEPTSAAAGYQLVNCSASRWQVAAVKLPSPGRATDVPAVGRTSPCAAISESAGATCPWRLAAHSLRLDLLRVQHEAEYVRTASPGPTDEPSGNSCSLLGSVPRHSQFPMPVAAADAPVSLRLDASDTTRLPMEAVPLQEDGVVSSGHASQTGRVCLTHPEFGGPDS